MGSVNIPVAPKSVYYILRVDSAPCGYVLWSAKNGFRSSTIVELEQIAIYRDFAGQGLGRRLIENSIELFRQHLENLGFSTGAILVTTSEGNFAEQLYTSTLGVERTGTIPRYGAGTEVILFRHDWP